MGCFSRGGQPEPVAIARLGDAQNETLKKLQEREQVRVDLHALRGPSSAAVALSVGRPFEWNSTFVVDSVNFRVRKTRLLLLWSPGVEPRGCGSGATAEVGGKVSRPTLGWRNYEGTSSTPRIKVPGRGCRVQGLGVTPATPKGCLSVTLNPTPYTLNRTRIVTGVAAPQRAARTQAHEEEQRKKDLLLDGNDAGASKTRGYVGVLGWMSANAKHVDKICEWWRSQGFEAYPLLTGPPQLFCPSWKGKPAGA